MIVAGSLELSGSEIVTRQTAGSWLVVHGLIRRVPAMVGGLLIAVATTESYCPLA